MRPIFILAFCLSLTCSNGQGVTLVKLSKLQQSIDEDRDRVQVINFWATWCAPCVKEMPLFEKLSVDRKDVHVRLVSVDLDLDPDPEKVRRFVTRKKLVSEVVILNETNPNDWIDKIDKSWSGAIPATLIINNKTGKRKFIEKELHAGELEELIASVK